MHDDVLAGDQRDEENQSLDLPPPETLREIERKQNERARELQRKRRSTDSGEGAGAGNDERATSAASSRHQRGNNQPARRTLKGLGMDPSTRWSEAVKDAEYRNLTRPMSKLECGEDAPTATRRKRVRERWAHAGAVARHAGGDEVSECSDDDDTGNGSGAYNNSSSSSSSRISSSSSVQNAPRAKVDRNRYAKTMGLEYFLEMVDQKHRYGSNLRRYHREWMQSDTQENFFYWLDHGDGRGVDLEDRPRSRLDSEHVRYLSREERRHYRVLIDEHGRLCWEKNGEPITTSPDFRDSIAGVVPRDDDTPTWREVTTGEKEPLPAEDEDDADSISDSSSSASTTISTGQQENGSKYVNEELHEASGASKLRHVNVDTIMNHMLRKTTKSNTWIFVADTSFRLYIGIKQSGAFQHSSFLQGARIAAAGLVKIKRGQLRKLSPLSGHYAPPVRSFRAFVSSLRSSGADLSRLSVSRSYAVILGLEAYLGVKHRGNSLRRGIVEAFRPEAKRRREQAERDTSESAEKERRVLEKEERERKRNSVGGKLLRQVGLVDVEEEEENSPAEKFREECEKQPGNALNGSSTASLEAALDGKEEQTTQGNA